MTLESTLTKTHFLGNGAATVFPLPFPVIRPEHLRLLLTSPAGKRDTPITSGYRVDGCGTDTVSVVYPLSGPPLPGGFKLTVYRLLPYVQQLDLENGGAFDAEVIEGQFDTLEMQIQQLAEETARAVKISVTSEEQPLTAEDIYAQVNRIADRAEDAVDQAGEAARRAERLLETMEEIHALATGAKNLRATWITAGALPAGSTLDLPVGYYPGRNTLLLFLDGLACHPANAETAPDLPQYQEQGEAERLSYRVTLLFDAPPGAVWGAWSVSGSVPDSVSDSAPGNGSDSVPGSAAGAQPEDGDPATDSAAADVAEAVQAARDAAEQAESAAADAARIAAGIQEEIMAQPKHLLDSEAHKDLFASTAAAAAAQAEAVQAALAAHAQQDAANQDSAGHARIQYAYGSPSGGSVEGMIWFHLV